jgi:hypothetical protein
MALQPCPAYYAGPEKFIRNWARFTRGLPVEMPVANEFPTFDASLVQARDICSKFLSFEGHVFPAGLTDAAARRTYLTRDFDSNANALRIDQARLGEYVDALDRYIIENIGPAQINKSLLEDFFLEGDPAKFIVEGIHVSVPHLEHCFHSLGGISREYQIDGHRLLGPVPAIPRFIVDIKLLNGVKPGGGYDAELWAPFAIGNCVPDTEPGRYKLLLDSPLWHMFRTAWKMSRFPNASARALGPRGMLPLAHGFTAWLTRRMSSANWRTLFKGPLMNDIVEKGYQLGNSLF